ncbi:hypothetical protein GR925_34040 [Streptomyces sp. HUCO-GS316]|uniref:hypothetical protein n=1 Tax=Streptomyces sp. HUCO-GS316 TaxID=2692198 RepID=UPI00136B710C|nr:hypothetical protein [Streptomyces sp. HUCO-GS316]MXM68312.1 hypothetical protein [Streptomyces sp. HUCO-GS316]
MPGLLRRTVELVPVKRFLKGAMRILGRIAWISYVGFVSAVSGLIITLAATGKL